MRKILVGLVILVVVAVGLLLIAPQFIPTEVYRKEVTERAEASLGRKLEINGDIKLRIIPRVQLVLEDVVLHNPNGFGVKDAAPFASLKTLRLTVNIWKLLDKELIIEEFELSEPHITLIETAKGKTNWEFKTAQAEEPAKTAEKSASSVPQIQLPELSIKDGRIDYLPADKQKHATLEQVQLSLRLPDMNESASVDISGVYNTLLPFHVKGDITSPAAWLAGKETSFALEIDALAKQTHISTKGKATPQNTGNPTIHADVNAEIASLKALGGALKQEILPTWNGNTKTTLRTKLAFEKEKLSLSDLALALDDIAVNGNASVTMGKKPSIRAELASAKELRLDSLFMKDEATAKGEAAHKEEVKGATGYSTDPLMADTSVLSSADADITLSAPAIHYEQFSIGAVKPHIVLKQGNLAITLPEFALYDGTAKATVQVSPAGKQALSLRLNSEIAKANVGSLLRAAQATDKLDGNGNLSLALSAQGGSVDGLVRGLNGTAALALQDGAIKGYNLVETMQSLKNIVGNIKALKKGDASALKATSTTTAKTDFSSLTATFNFANGIGTNNDLSMKAPLLNLTGTGTIDLPQQQLDYKLTPQVVASVEGQSRNTEAAALNFPVRVHGPFGNLSFTPDTSGLVQELLKDPKGATKAIENNVKDVRDGLKSILKGL